MTVKALIVIEVQGDSVLPGILHLAKRADLVILDRNGTTKKRLPTALKRVVSYTTTRGIDPNKPNYSAFDGGTLRPIESLEDILRREKVSEVTVCGDMLNSIAVISQTAFDARALGYTTMVCADATIEIEYNMMSPALERAGIDIKQSGEIWTE